MYGDWKLPIPVAAQSGAPFSWIIDVKCNTQIDQYSVLWPFCIFYVFGIVNFLIVICFSTYIVCVSSWSVSYIFSRLFGRLVECELFQFIFFPWYYSFTVVIWCMCCPVQVVGAVSVPDFLVVLFVIQCVYRRLRTWDVGYCHCCMIIC
jgi:hypothetical protein